MFKKDEYGMFNDFIADKNLRDQKMTSFDTKRPSLLRYSFGGHHFANLSFSEWFVQCCESISSYEFRTFEKL